MKFKCCENLMHHLVFAQSDVMACCCAKDHDFIKFYKQENNEIFDIEQYKNTRNFYISQFKNNIIPNGCKNCPFIVEKEWDENIKYNNIIIANRTKCSCNCIYCSLLEGDFSGKKKKELNERNSYDIKPILKALDESSYIEENCNIQIVGGEPTEYPNKEFEWLLHFATNRNCKIEVLSSGINYSKELGKILKTYSNNIKILISPDSGTKELYKKIKQINAFDKVWGNISKYIKDSKKNNNAQIYLKYIIIPQINDSIEDVTNFIKKCEKVNCKNIVFSIDFNWIEKNVQVSNELKDLVIYIFDNYIYSHTNIDFSFEPQTKNWFYKIRNAKEGKQQ